MRLHHLAIAAAINMLRIIKTLLGKPHAVARVFHLPAELSFRVLHSIVQSQCQASLATIRSFPTLPLLNLDVSETACEVFLTG